MSTSQSYYNETQAIFIELFDRPAGAPGYDYFGSELATGADPITVFGQISGSPEVTAGVTITSLFENLLARAPLAPALAFFGGELAAGQTIANIANQIYQDVLNEPSTSQDNMLITDKIAYSNNYTDYLIANSGFAYNTDNASAYINQVTPAGVMSGVIPTPPTSSSMPSVGTFSYCTVNVAAFASTLGSIASSLANPNVYTLASSDAGHTFASGTQSDTLVIPLDYQSTSLGQAGNGAYFTFQGDASGHNAVDINYDPVYTSNISYYLQNATNFQILDFNYSQGAYSNLYSSPLDLSTINSGFNTFILDGTYNTGTYGSYSDYGFTNASNSDTFVVQATTMELDIFSSTNGNGNTANVIMDGGTGGVGLGTLEFSPSSAVISNPTVNIDSVGSAPNTIQVMGDMMVTGNNLTGSFTLNVYGSDALSIGAAFDPSYTAVSANDNGVELQDGSTLTIAGCSASSNLTAYIYENSPTITHGVTVNAGGFAGTLSLIETQFQNPSPDTFILGSGTDSVATNNVNASVTVGSGTDTIISNAAYSTDSSVAAGESSLNTTPGQITTIYGSITAGDSVIFGTPLGIDPANWQIYPGLYDNGNGTPSPGTGVAISSLTQYNESGAASPTAAIIAAISALEVPWDTWTVSSSPQAVAAAQLDYAGWFTYGGNTYIVNSDQGQNQVVELVGTYDLSHATYNSAAAATITGIVH
jgi:hypothetical protein